MENKSNLEIRQNLTHKIKEVKNNNKAYKSLNNDHYGV
jgi:hypothetical protein